MELKDVPGIGDKTLATLGKAGITTIDSLLTTFPRTYRTYRATTIAEAEVGEWVVLKGTVSRPASRHNGRTSTQVATLWDLSGSLTLRWFNMPYISRSIIPSATYLVKGQLTIFAGKKQLVSPSLTAERGIDTFTDQIVPIYRSTAGVKPWIIRQKISQTLAAIPKIPDPFPAKFLDRYALVPYDYAIRSIHTPDSDATLELAIRRLSFQELYELQIQALRNKKSGHLPGPKLQFDQKMVDSFLNNLPFTPTTSQTQAIQAILTDLSQGTAMHRLLQGEVGSGKTIVAAAAGIACYSAGYRTLLMAPTQILANQLYDNFRAYCTPLGISVTLVTAKSKANQNADILIGTQALLNLTKVTNLGLVIVDEQHRFGVVQREMWQHRAKTPHFLQMTATPIPRSLAQTIFRQLDITRLTDLPKNRLPTKTFVVPEYKRQDSYRFIRHQVLTEQNQVFIVVPLIEAAEEQDTTPLKSLKLLESELQHELPDMAIDVMHGKMKENEKIEHMRAFKDGITQVLVATSMIEVGLDIPDANIMVIEDAERFGLAQLHQLRGRVGRGGKQGYCLLFTSSSTEKALDRLAYFVRVLDGEKLAHYDLEKRGPGKLFGTLQSGYYQLGLGNLYDDQLLKETYEAASLTLSMDK